jgi:hypothetical protein
VVEREPAALRDGVGDAVEEKLALAVRQIDEMRALKGVDADTAAGVKQAARERFAEHTDETNLERLRTLLVDGRHSLNEMKQFMVTAVVR